MLNVITNFNGKRKQKSIGEIRLHIETPFRKQVYMHYKITYFELCILALQFNVIVAVN